jgi:hypothetical protein
MELVRSLEKHETVSDGGGKDGPAEHSDQHLHSIRLTGDGISSIMQAPALSNIEQVDISQTPTHRTAEEGEINNSNGCGALRLTIEKVADGEGSLITLGKFFGFWTAPWSWLPEQSLKVQALHFHPSDIVLAGYSKSGEPVDLID